MCKGEKWRNTIFVVCRITRMCYSMYQNFAVPLHPERTKEQVKLLKH